MQNYRLKFGSFIHHDNGIFETIIDEDVELSEQMVQEFFDLILSIEPKLELCLINRKNNYSYSFKANMMLASSNIANHVAVVKYGKLPWPISKLLTPKFYRIGFFDDYYEAMLWLLKKNNPS